MSAWQYQGADFDPELIGDYHSFVYLMVDRENGKRYIGRKIFRNTKTLPPLRGQKRKRKIVTESNWRDYFSSNETINRLVKDCGEERFERTILRLCRTASEAAYWEAKLQFENDVLLDHNYYNDLVMVRLNSRHLRTMQKG
ncbi:hypothetical protein MZK49_05685 [Ensifer sesbaniae]|uniref:hypothetical protein n=1 Tax=Ensifer sesbaniae TaxID=1214071 RepID=UPI0020017FA9|nr:hypothetical protein [Ensifer sesbaniae]